MSCIHHLVGSLNVTNIGNLPSQDIKRWIKIVVNETTIEYYLVQVNSEFMMFVKFLNGEMYNAGIIRSLEKKVRPSVVG
jgi:hypothetical protein